VGRGCLPAIDKLTQPGGRIAKMELSLRSLCLIGLLASVALLPACQSSPQEVRAEDSATAQSPIGLAVIDHDVFMHGEEVNLEGIINGDAFLIGSEVSLRGDVNGSVFILADSVELQGTIAGNVFVAAVSVRQQSGAAIERSLYSLGISLITEREAEIGRDLNAVALSGNLRGGIGRDTRIVIGLFELLRTLQASLQRSITGLPVLTPGIHESGGHFASDDPSAQSIRYRLAGADQTQNLYSLKEVQPAGIDTANLGPWLLSRLLALLTFILVGGLTLWFFPVAFARWTETVRQRPLASAGTGALMLINGFLLPVLLVLLLGALIAALISISLPTIAWMIFGVSLGATTTALSLFLLIVTYLSKAIVAVVAGALILSRFGQELDARNRWYALLIGLVLYVALASIPYFGFVVGLIVTLLGLGGLWLGRSEGAAAGA
jgi:hypothetical protein